MSFLATCLSIVLATSLSGGLSFKHLDMGAGNNQGSVFSMVTDDSGCTWFATSTGLKRYDGHSVRPFVHGADEHSLPDNLVHCVDKDRYGRIWAGTELGLAVYDTRADVMTRVELPFSTPVRFVRCIDSLSVLVSSLSETIVVDQQTLAAIDGSRSRLSILSSLESTQGLLISCRDSCVYHYYPSDYSAVRALPQKLYVTAMYEAPDSSLWMGTFSKGLYQYSSDGSMMRCFAREDGLCSNSVRSLAEGPSGSMWVGTSGGLNIVDLGDMSIRASRSDPFDNTSLSHNSILCFNPDGHGGLWIGSFYGGADYWSASLNRFSHISYRGESDMPNEMIVNSIAILDENHLLVGMNKGGILRYDMGRNLFEPVPIPSFDNVQTLFIPDGADYIMAGSHGDGLVMFDRKSGKLLRHHPVPFHVYCIVPALGADGLCWVGTLGGLRLYDVRRGVFRAKEPIHQSRILSLMRDSEGRLWVGSKEGLGVYTEQDNHSLKLCMEQSKADIGSVPVLMESSDRTVWAGSLDGLLSFDGLVCKCRYNIDDGLPNSAVRCIEEDESGRLWVGTDGGLWRYDMNSGGHNAYTTSTGLRWNMFIKGASLRLEDGTMYFGGFGGMIRFNPFGIEDSRYSPKALITGLSVSGEEVRPGDESGILGCAVMYADHIRLKYWQNNIALSFSCPNYSSWQQNTFSYKMDGVDKTWHNTKGHSVNFANLPAGTYTFMVKAANSDGFWNDDPACLKIVITPVWYKTLAANVLFLLIGIGAILLAFAIYMHQKELKNQLEIERLMQKHKEEVDKMKVYAFLKSGPMSKKLTGPGISPSEEHFLLNAIQTVETHMSDPSFSVEDFASAMHMSRSNLHIKLSSATGESALDFIKKVRFTEACRLLDQSQLTVSEVASKCGFRSLSYFSSSFRQYVGYSPSEFQNRIK